MTILQLPGSYAAGAAIAFVVLTAGAVGEEKDA